IVEEAQIALIDELLSVTFITVALSVLLHGVTAAPLARRFGERAARMGSCEENEVVGELPLRAGRMPGK
ncbi:MAG: hypothetical protein OEU92_24725, partial [Alphaproteobacteria bacterium]|nr:hypothetical protein [Alphaproteobacteria bacterium]